MDDSDNESVSKLERWSEALDKDSVESSIKIRESYILLSEEIQKNNDESGEAGVDMEALILSVERADEIFKEVKKNQEARLDTGCLKQIAFLGRSRIEKTQSSLLSFNPSEYASNLLNYMKNSGSNIALEDDVTCNISTTDLRKISKELKELSSESYGMEPIFGALDWKAPQRKGKVHERETSSQSKKNTEVVKIHDSTTNEETQINEVNRLYACLKDRYVENGKKPIIFLEFIIDPNSFSNTIENMFHTSFLLRDGFVKVAPCKEHKIPRIMPLSKSDKTGAGQKNYQAVLNMNCASWKEAIELLELKGKEPMIAPRPCSSKRKQ